MEDGAQGFGGNINGKKACSFGDISTTSFFPAKPLGCYGDGGAIFTDNDDWAQIIRSICVHGKDISDLNNPNAKYNNIRIGRNSRLDTLQAAILIPKLQAFKEYELDSINSVAAWYSEGLSDTNVVLPEVKEGFYSSWAQYTIQLPEGINRKDVQNRLKTSGIPSMVYYTKPMHLQEAFSGTRSAIAHCPITEELCSKVLSLPIDPYKTKEEVDFVVDEIKKALKYT
jgi:dTDP-4-amino-4,6-dideoxygalactose transaminase